MSHSHYLTGFGQHYSHKDTNFPYAAGTWQDLWAQAFNPPSAPKDQSAWAIFSTYNAPDARAVQPQREHGSFTALWVDIDHGDPEQSTVAAAVRQALGPGAAFLIYNSVSTGELRTAPSDYIDRQTGKVLHTDHPGSVKLKHRVIIPLATPLSAFEWVVHQFALNNMLLRAGLFPDFVSCNLVQLCFLPNRGLRYDPPHSEPGNLFNPAISPLAAELEQYRSELTRQTTRPAYKGFKQETPRSYIAAFRRRHPTEQVLLDCGFTSKDGGKNWHHPHQGGRSYSTQLYEDGGLFTLSSTVGGWGGAPDGHGGYYFQDGYNLYRHFFFADDDKKLVEYARMLLKQEDDARYGAATAEHGKQVWEAITLHLRKAGAEQAAALINSAGVTPESFVKSEWDIDWPPGALGELAKWIYRSSSRPIKQYSIAAALYFYSVAGRKFNVNGSGLNLFILLIGETGRGKGIVKTAIDKLVRAIIDDAQNPSLGAPFSYEIAVSESGLRKALSQQNPICAYEEELGLTLVPLTQLNPTANDLALKKMLTRLYDSGEHRSLGHKEASDKDRVRNAVNMPTMTIAGDTQPHIYKSLLGADTIDSGFGPRMLQFYYDGPRKHHNPDSVNHSTPPAQLVRVLRTFLEHCLLNGEQVHHIPFTSDAEALHKHFDMELDSRINQGEPGVEMLNRAAATVGRVAGLIALGRDYYNPVIDEEAWSYAHAIVSKGLETTQSILRTGGAGSGESVRMYALRKAVEEYVTGQIPQAQLQSTYKTPKSILGNTNVINELFLIRYLSYNKDFKGNGVRTTEQNIRETLREAIAQGIIEEAALVTDNRTKQRMYQVGPDY